MPTKQASLLDLKSFSISKIESLFSLVKKIKSEKPVCRPKGETIGLLFFEASTRTRMSFETAALRIGLGPVLLDGGMKSSLEKGESIEDSVLNVAAMGHQLLVIRCGDQVDLLALSKQIKSPIINAGWGAKGHPTQALLDTYTMQEKLGSLKGRNVLFLGDIRHSRVASSHFEILESLGAKVILCAPSGFLPTGGSFEVIEDLEQALAKADVVMALRCQFERHSGGDQTFSVQEYREKFGLSLKRLKSFQKSGLIMHPGPVNHGIEMETEVMTDSRCQILEQVTNGVFVREAILRTYLEGSF